MREKLKVYVQYLIAFLLLAGLAYFADLNKIISKILETNLFFYSFAMLMFLSIYLWSGLRWKALIRKLDYEISLFSLIKVISISYSFNKLLPLNSGDIMRSKILEKYIDVEKHGKLLGTVVMERTMDVILLGFITVISGAMVLQTAENLYIGFPAIIVPLLTIFLLRFKSETLSRLLLLLNRFGMPENISELIENAIDGFNNISWRQLSEATVWHLFRWTSGILVLYILGLSLGSDISIVAAAFTTGIMNILAALPITPAGLGPVEAGGTGALMLTGLGSSEAAALVVLQRSLGFILMAGLGALVLLVDQKSIS